MRAHAYPVSHAKRRTNYNYEVSKRKIYSCCMIQSEVWEFEKYNALLNACNLLTKVTTPKKSAEKTHFLKEEQ